MHMPFDFQPWPLRNPDDHLVVKVPAGLRKRADLYAALAQGGRFPEWFSNDWGTLSGCLLDLGWVPQPCVAIVHEDVPLYHQLEVCRTYLQILLESVQDWRRRDAPPQPRMAPAQAGGRARLRVVFPRAAFGKIHRRLHWQVL
ncbi:MAG: barstar family protein [Pseudomonadota bacterium]